MGFLLEWENNQNFMVFHYLYLLVVWYICQTTLELIDFDIISSPKEEV